MENYLYQEVTGKFFNELVGNQPLLKFLAGTYVHFGFEYKLGLNIDSNEFNPSGICKAGGLYFSVKEYISEYVSFGVNMAYITIPDDARVYIEEKKCKADKFIINSIISVYEYIETLPDEHKLEYRFYFPCSLAPNKIQTPEICLEAVKKNGIVLRYVKEQTPEICMTAIKENVHALQYVRNQTPEICMAAVQQDGNALEYVKEQTPEICLAAVRQSGWALQFVKEQTPEICLAALRQSGYVLKYVTNQTPEICLAAIQENVWALQDVKVQTPEICFAAVKKFYMAICYVKDDNIRYSCRHIAQEET